MERLQRRILVVEDNDAVARFVAAALSGFDTDVAGDEAGALRLLGERSYDLVVTDLDLGKGSGLTVADGADRRSPPVPVLFMTGGAEASAIEEAVRRGGRAILMKPFAVDDLKRAVDGVLGGS